MHTTFEPVRESSLSASTGMNLRFDDHDRVDISNLVRDLFGFLRRGGDFPRVVATPNFSNSSLAWYSWIFIEEPLELAREARVSNGFLHH